MSGLSGGEGLFGCGPRLEGKGRRLGWETIGAGGNRLRVLREGVRVSRLVTTCITVM